MFNDAFDPIAIVGLAGRFPGAADTGQFWLNIAGGTESVAFLSDDELLKAGVPASALSDPAYVRAVAQAPDLDLFDAGFFGLTPREARVADPQIRLFLEVAHAAMENAGYAPDRVTDVGVFGSVGKNRYVQQATSLSDAELRSNSGMLVGSLNNPDYVATLVSYKFNFHGPSMTLMTACSSSLLAVQIAAQALTSGQCELAIAGGVDIEYPVGHGYWWSPGSPYSRDGHCRPFDADASGTLFGSGAGAVILRRLCDAVADGDSIRAVIRGMAVNNDGSDKIGFSAPSVAGQRAVVMEALAIAGVSPAEISLVEAHGTGTPMGDPIEFTALSEAFKRLGGEQLNTGSCAVGSVKGNIGHLGHAAGVASLIKVVLALENECIPQVANLNLPNPKLPLDGSPFFLPDSARPWCRVPDRPRRACLSSLGIGGTNVHAVVEEAPVPPPATSDRLSRIVIWSAKTPEAADSYRGRLADYFAADGAGRFADAVSTLQLGRTAHRVRSALVSADAAAVASALKANAGTVTSAGSGRTAARPAIFLLPGQGAQHAAMAHDLYARDRAFAGHLDQCLELFAAAGSDLGGIWRSAASDDALMHTSVAQPLLFSVSYALARTWTGWGVSPSGLLGHSVGELAAAAVADIFTLPDAVRLVAARAEAMAAMPPGTMLAVAGPESAVQPLLVPGAGIAASNAARQTVVSGSAEAVAEFERRAMAAGLATRAVAASHAFHSPMMAQAAESFLRTAATISASAPRIGVYSAASGTLMTDEQAADPAFWAAQVTAPVLFAEALDAALTEQPDCLLIECGPGRTLTALARQHAKVRSGACRAVPTLPARRAEPDEERRSVLDAAAAAWVDGHELDWTALYGGTRSRRIPVPGYPYQRQRYWIDAQPSDPAAAGASGTGASGNGAGGTGAIGTGAGGTVSGENAAGAAGGSADLAADAGRPQAAEAPGAVGAAGAAGSGSPFSVLSWVQCDPPPAPARATRIPALALLPADRRLAADLTALLWRAGLEVIAVKPGDGFASTGAGYQVRPGSAGDLGQVLSAVTDAAGRDRYPQLLVHAWTVDDQRHWDALTLADRLEFGFHSLLALAKQGARMASGRLPDLLVLTERSADVSGAETLDPARAMLHGVVRTLALEEPRTASSLIDVGGRIDEQTLVAEILAAGRPVVTAVRADRRWVRVERPSVLTAGDRSVLRQQGSYLVTGGLGGLGLAVAKGLARTGMRPRLVLLGRHEPADSARAALDDLAALGAEVRTVACDVTDAAALAAAVAETGPFHGVFHLAGVSGDRMLQVRDRADAAATMAPKVLGTVALAEVLADQPALDLFVCFGSRAGIDGLVGGGDYAAANAFMSSLAENGLPGTRTVSIDWPAWSQVGMAVPSLAVERDRRERDRRERDRRDRERADHGDRRPVAHGEGEPVEPEHVEPEHVEPEHGEPEHGEPRAGADGARRWQTLLSVESYPALDEHRLGQVAVLPGSGHIDLIVRAFRAEAAGGDSRPVHLSQVFFLQPLAVPHACQLQIAFEPKSTGDWAFVVRAATAQAGRDGPWTDHVSGQIGLADADQPRTDIAALTAAMPVMTPRPRKEGLFTLGPHWDLNPEILSAPGDDSERLLTLALPEVFAAEAAEHEVHPTLLDAATSSTRLDHEPAHIPLMYRDVIVYGKLTPRLLSHMRRKDAADGLIVADVDLLSPDGAVLVRIAGFTMRRLPEGGLPLTTAVTTPNAAAAPPVGARPADAQRAVAQSAASQTGYAQPAAARPNAAEPNAAQPLAAQPLAAQPLAAQPLAAQPLAAQPLAAQPPAAQPGAADSSADEIGIPPQVGVDLLFRILDGSPSRRRVAVRPFLAGRPVPIEIDAATAAYAGPDAALVLARPVMSSGPAPASATSLTAAAPASAPPVSAPPPSALPASAPAPAPTASVPTAATPTAATPTAPVLSSAATQATAPDRGLIGKVTMLWTEALGIEDISPTDNFFELGGNSLLAVDVTAQIRSTFGVDIGIAALFDLPTVSDLAAELRRLGVPDAA